MNALCQQGGGKLGCSRAMFTAFPAVVQSLKGLHSLFLIIPHCKGRQARVVLRRSNHGVTRMWVWNPALTQTSSVILERSFNPSKPRLLFCKISTLKSYEKGLNEIAQGKYQALSLKHSECSINYRWCYLAKLFMSFEREGHQESSLTPDLPLLIKLSFSTTYPFSIICFIIWA